MKKVEKRLTVLLRANGDDLRWGAFATQRSGCDVDVIKSVGLKLLQRILRHRRDRTMTANGGRKREMRMMMNVYNSEKKNGRLAG